MRAGERLGRRCRFAQQLSIMQHLRAHSHRCTAAHGLGEHVAFCLAVYRIDERPARPPRSGRPARSSAGARPGRPVARRLAGADRADAASSCAGLARYVAFAAALGVISSDASASRGVALERTARSRLLFCTHYIARRWPRRGPARAPLSPERLGRGGAGTAAGPRFSELEGERGTRRRIRAHWWPCSTTRPDAQNAVIGSARLCLLDLAVDAPRKRWSDDRRFQVRPRRRCGCTAALPARVARARTPSRCDLTDSARPGFRLSWRACAREISSRRSSDPPPRATAAIVTAAHLANHAATVRYLTRLAGPCASRRFGEPRAAFRGRATPSHAVLARGSVVRTRPSSSPLSSGSSRAFRVDLPTTTAPTGTGAGARRRVARARAAVMFVYFGRLRPTPPGWDVESPSGRSRPLRCYCFDSAPGSTLAKEACGGWWPVCHHPPGHRWRARRFLTHVERCRASPSANQSTGSPVGTRRQPPVKPLASPVIVVARCPPMGHEWRAQTVALRAPPPWASGRPVAAIGLLRRRLRRPSAASPIVASYQGPPPSRSPSGTALSLAFGRPRTPYVDHRWKRRAGLRRRAGRWRAPRGAPGCRRRSRVEMMSTSGGRRLRPCFFLRQRPLSRSPENERRPPPDEHFV